MEKEAGEKTLQDSSLTGGAEAAVAYSSSTKRIAKNTLMRGKKYLAKNMLILTIGQFGTKILCFFLVPLYTSVLTSSEYGTYDIYSVTVSLFVPILTLNISDAAMRFLLDKTSSKKGVISISLRCYVLSLLVFGLFCISNACFKFVPVLSEYNALLFLMFAVNGISQLLLNFARGFDRLRDVSVSGVLCSAVMIVLNLILLIPLRMGLKGYFLATIAGMIVQSAYLLYSLRIFRYTELGKVDRVLQKKMTSYSCPMMLNSVSWWVNSVSDRYIVTWLCGIGENGIYSVAYKIPSVLNMLQGIFSQAWTLSAVQDFDREDGSGFFSKMYAIYNACMVLLCSILIAVAKPMARLMYANDFYEAWHLVPFLLVSSVFGALSGYLGGIFAAVKDSKSFAISSAIGAVINIALNIVLIHFIGTMGAAIATMASYIVVWGLRIWRAKRIMRLAVCVVKDCVGYAILILQCIVVLTETELRIWSYAASCMSFLVTFALYKGIFFQLVKNIGRKACANNKNEKDSSI